MSAAPFTSSIAPKIGQGVARRRRAKLLDQRHCECLRRWKHKCLLTAGSLALAVWEQLYVEPRIRPGDRRPLEKRYILDLWKSDRAKLREPGVVPESQTRSMPLECFHR